MSKQLSSEPISSGLVQYPTPAIPYVPPTDEDLKILFDSMFDEHFETPIDDTWSPSVTTAPVPYNSNGLSVSTLIDQEAQSASHSPSLLNLQSPSVHQGTAVHSSFEVNLFAPPDYVPSDSLFASKTSYEASISRDLSMATSVPHPQPHDHLSKWTNDYLNENIIENPSQQVST